MRKNFFKVFLTLLVTILICGCFGEKVVTADMIGGLGEKSDKPKPQPKLDPIEEQLKSMTLAEKVGQMVMIGFYGTETNDDIKFLLNEFHFGGVIFFDRNLESVDQTKRLSDSLQAGKKIPLFIAIDEEGGRVARGKNFLTPAPSQEDIGLDGDVSAATYWAKYNSDLLKSIGVNVNFAPVADVGSNDTRSFSSDAQSVAEFVNAAAVGYEEKKIFYTLKHFPGIGKGTVDSHKEVSTVYADRATLDAEDLLPFKKIIAGRDNSRFMIMVGHLQYDAIDPNNSASLSSEVVTNLLRRDLGFDGVIITDDLDMGAIKNHVDSKSIGVKIVEAGCDIALICHNYEVQQNIYNGILTAVQSGEISEERINESVRRILKMKAHLRGR